MRSQLGALAVQGNLSLPALVTRRVTDGDDERKSGAFATSSVGGGFGASEAKKGDQIPRFPRPPAPQELPSGRLGH